MFRQDTITKKKQTETYDSHTVLEQEVVVGMDRTTKAILNRHDGAIDLLVRPGKSTQPPLIR